MVIIGIEIWSIHRGLFRKSYVVLSVPRLHKKLAELTGMMFGCFLVFVFGSFTGFRAISSRFMTRRVPSALITCYMSLQDSETGSVLIIGHEASVPVMTWHGSLENLS